MSEILRTKADVYKLSSDELKRKMSTPAGINEINQALKATEDSPVVTPEEAAAVQAAKEVADAQVVEAAKEVADAQAAEAARVAAEATVVIAKPWEAEDAGYQTYGIHITRDAQGQIQRIVQEYQVKDESGNPIGRPTHLEARSWAEFIAKKDECHVQATRAFNRLKSQKVSFKNQQPAEPEYKPLTDDEMAQLVKDLKGDDATKAVEAARKIAGSEV